MTLSGVRADTDTGDYRCVLADRTDLQTVPRTVR